MCQRSTSAHSNSRCTQAAPMTHFSQWSQLNWLLKLKPLRLFPPIHSSLPQLKKLEIKKKKEIFWLLPENISFLQSHCAIPHFELNYAQTWPYFLDTNSSTRNLFLLICGRGRSQEDTKIQSEKAETALHPKADARFLLTLSARSQEVLSTLHSPGQQESYQSPDATPANAKNLLFIEVDGGEVSHCSPWFGF